MYEMYGPSELNIILILIGICLIIGILFACFIEKIFPDNNIPSDNNISNDINEEITIPIPTPFSPGLIRRKIVNGKVVSETVTHLLPHGGNSIRKLK